MKNYYQQPYYQQPQQGNQFEPPKNYQQQYQQQQPMQQGDLQKDDQFVPFPVQTPGQITLPFIEQSYIENILRLNKGKVATVYMNFENSQWGSKIFKGVLEEAGKDHIILKDLSSEMRYLLLSIYLSYVTFDEDIEYFYPYAESEKQPNQSQ